MESFIQAHSGISANVLLSLWEVIPDSIFDAEQQRALILDEIEGLSPIEMVTALFWVESGDRLERIKRELKNWMEGICHKIAELEEIVKMESLEIHGRANLRTLREIAIQIGRVMEEVRELNDWNAQLGGCLSLVNRLYYERRVEENPPDERKAVDELVMVKNESGLERIVDVVLKSELEGGGNCRMFVSQEEESCLVATTLTEGE
jgi:hypothetical protein